MITTARMMEAPSSHPSLIPCMKMPNASDRIAAPHKIFMVSSSKVAKIMSVIVLGGLVMASLVPNFLIRQSLSLAVPVMPF